MGALKIYGNNSSLRNNDIKMEKQNSIKSTIAAAATTTEAEQGGGGGGEHIDFTSSSSFSNHNSEEFKPQFQKNGNGGHIELASSSSFSNYNHSGEFKPTRPSHHGHIELASSSSFSNYNSAEFKIPKRRERARDDSSAGSSISSDRTVLIHSSPPIIKRVEERIPAPALKKPPEKQKLPDKPPAVVSRPPGQKNKDEQAVPILKKPEAAADNNSSTLGFGTANEGGGGGGSRRFKTSPSSIARRRARKEQLLRKVAFGFRVIGLLFSFVSISIMVANRKQGWAIDSFDRYKEFRYCVIVNIIACLYSGGQALHLGYQLVTGRGFILQHLRSYLDFFIDQMVSYVLISASSSATTRVDDWRSNWGNDKFPDMASASVSLSFLAFGALASSSIISGYSLCTFNSS